MKKVLFYIWQLPQNILGLILLLLFGVDKKLSYKGVSFYVCRKGHFCASLGDVVIVDKFPTNKYLWEIVKHEYGHHVQSERLGWFYLVVIGLPSITFKIYDRLFHDGSKKWVEWFYNLPWEKDADKKGGVVR